MISNLVWWVSVAALCLACEPTSTTIESEDGGVGGSGGRSNSNGGRAGSAAGSGAAPEGSGGDPDPGSGATAGSRQETGGSGAVSGSGAAAAGGEAGEGEPGSGGMAGGAISGSAGMAGTAGIPIANGPAEIARVICDKLFECCTEAELMALPLNIGDSESACQIGVSLYLAVIVEASTESIEAGRIRYDGVALEACLDRYRNEACGVVEKLDLSICPDVFAPQIALGEACGISAECIEGYCEGSNDAANPVGECAPKKQDGTACAANDECQSGLCEALGDGCVPVSTAPICGG